MELKLVAIEVGEPNAVSCFVRTLHANRSGLIGALSVVVHNRAEITNSRVASEAVRARVFACARRKSDNADDIILFQTASHSFLPNVKDEPRRCVARPVRKHRA